MHKTTNGDEHDAMDQPSFISGNEFHPLAIDNNIRSYDDGNGSSMNEATYLLSTKDAKKKKKSTTHMNRRKQRPIIMTEKKRRQHYDHDYAEEEDDDSEYSSSSSLITRWLIKLERCLPTGEYVHFVFYTILWNILFSLFAACICFWIPNFSFWGISISSMMKNALGCFFIAIVTAFQQVKFQYFQTYCMYDAIKGGFLSVFTSFGNYIEDGDILLGMRLGWLKAPINYFATLLLSFIFYQTGRLVALKWKAGTAFSWSLMVMENEHHRMAFELASQDERMNVATAASTNATTTTTTSSKLAVLDTQSPRVIDSFNLKLQRHLSQQLAKRKRHTSKSLRRRHVVIMLLLLLFTLINVGAVAGISVYHWRRSGKIGNNNNTYKILWFEFLLSLFWCVSGSLTGRYISGLPLHKQRKSGVQWGTFRVNMLSCIFIGTAHNILFLRQSFPYGTTKYFEIIFQRFISDFCGSESNFAGLIDETTVLWNSRRVRRIIPLKNLFYNLFLCTIVFLVVVFSLRIILFNDLRMY